MKKVKDILFSEPPKQPKSIEFEFRPVPTSSGYRFEGGARSADGNLTIVVAEVDGMACMLASSRLDAIAHYVVRAEVSGPNGSFTGQFKLTGHGKDQLEETWQIADSLQLLGILGTATQLIAKVTFNER